MEPVSSKQVTRPASAVTVLAVILAGGCAGSKQLVLGKQATAGDAPAQVVATWNNQVSYAPDPTRGGALEPYLMGRMYLFGPGLASTLLTEGSVIVDLFDATPRGNGEPQMLEELRIDPESLKRLVKDDTFGQGFTIPFVWRTYRPDITQVNLILRFDPAKGGTSILHQSGILVVDHSATKEQALLQAKARAEHLLPPP